LTEKLLKLHFVTQ